MAAAVAASFGELPTWASCAISRKRRPRVWSTSPVASRASSSRRRSGGAFRIGRCHRAERGEPQRRLQVAQQGAVAQAEGVELARLLERGARGDEVAVRVDRGRGTEGGQHVALEGIDLLVQRANGRRLRDRGRREGPRELHDLGRCLGRSQVVEAGGRDRVPAVLQAGVVVDASLRQRGLPERAHEGGAHRGERVRARGGEAFAELLAHALPLGLEGGLVPRRRGPRLDPGRGRQVALERRQPLEGQEPAAVAQRRLRPRHDGLAHLLDLGPVLVRGRVRAQERRPAIDLGGQAVRGRLRPGVRGESEHQKSGKDHGRASHEAEDESDGAGVPSSLRRLSAGPRAWTWGGRSRRRPA